MVHESVIVAVAICATVDAESWIGKVGFLPVLYPVLTLSTVA